MNFSEQLKSQLNIVDVVQQYVRLKRQGSGARWVGLCPFHSEKTPSFGVHSTLGYYKCFGCDAAGDVFKFVQTIENLTFPETLRLLADRYGIPMPERNTFSNPEDQKRAALYEMHEAAAELFQSNLRGPQGEEARRYLESRNVSAQASAEFRLGLAIDSWDQLTQRLRKFGNQLMEESALVKKGESGGFYDAFRSRIMFPIHSEDGKVIGFGGRALGKDVQPKYLNSGETLLYKKKRVLYNLHRAKVDARKHDRMILVEGYMDVIGVYSAGIHEVVSISGTAMDLEQVRAIKRQVAQQNAVRGEVILNLDGDAAGVKSTEKQITAFLSEGLRVRVLEIPGALDPDEFIQQHGVAEYEKLLESAPSYFHWLADRARARFDLRSAEGRTDAFNFIWPAIQQVADKIERSAISRELADYLNLDREVVAQRFNQRSAPARVSARQSVGMHLPPNERILLCSLLTSGEARHAVRHYMQAASRELMFEAADIFDAVLNFDEGSRKFSIEAVAAALNERSQRILADLSFQETALSEENVVAQALSCLQALESKGSEADAQALKRRIKELEAQGQLAEAMLLYEQLNRTRRAHSG